MFADRRLRDRRLLTNGRLTRLIAILLGGTAVLFVIATTAERSSVHKESTAAASTKSTTAATSAPAESAPAEATHDEAAEKASGPTAAEKSGEPASAAAEIHSEPGDQKVLGVNLEGRSFVVLGALLSLAIAVTVWMRPTFVPLLAAGLFSAGFAGLDAVEARHQITEGRGALEAAAWVLFAAHVAIAALVALVALATQIEPSDRLPRIARPVERGDSRS